MEDYPVYCSVKKKIVPRLSALPLSEEENDAQPTVILGGHNVFNNSIANSLVVQVNASSDDIANTLENFPEGFQKKMLDAVLLLLERKHSPKHHET